MIVEEFIAAEAAKPFGWAVSDCTAMCDRWVRLRRGVSPVEAGRIAYGDRDSALRLLPRLAAMMSRGMRRAGLSKTLEPRKGDVGLVLFDGRIGPAIHAGTHWITRHEDGFIGAPLGNVWKAWRV
jgi:hypothetical protein